MIGFHSLEIRLVKNLFDEAAAPRPDPTNPYQATTTEGLDFVYTSRRPVKCSKEEEKRNPRSRSAVLRTIHKKGGPNDVR